MRDRPRDIQTPERRVFMHGVLNGIPRESIAIGPAQYLIPSPQAIRDEEQTILSGLTSRDDKKECRELYFKLLSHLDQARGLLLDAGRDADKDGLSERGKTVLLSTQLYFDKATHFAHQIETKYERILRAQHVDMTVGGGGGPAEHHEIDKKA